MNDEVYYDEHTDPTERLSIGAILASASHQPVIVRDYSFHIIGALLVAAGWYARELFAIAYDYHLLMLVTIVACYIVASRRD